PDNLDIVPLLYQSGYLTIQAYDDRRQRLTLGYPNDEVKYGFTTSLATEYLYNPVARNGVDIFAIDDAVEGCDTDLLREQFTALFARLPYVTGSKAAEDSMLERDFQNVIFLTFVLLGQFVQVEQHTAKGRADCIVETDKYVYIFEFKRDGNADEALSQIESQGYATPYSADSRTLVKIGAVFSSEQKNISEWKVVG
ncbi:MAG: PD-(D/E)XK nuclease domain-containing protein, partial [Treponema sp.]|nr:PD-(D/E)XK nuclease domain-containing protein [Treponema sp.]